VDSLNACLKRQWQNRRNLMPLTNVPTAVTNLDSAFFSFVTVILLTLGVVWVFLFGTYFWVWFSNRKNEGGKRYFIIKCLLVLIPIAILVLYFFPICVVPIFILLLQLQLITPH